MSGRGHPYAVLSAHAEMTESRARRRGLRTGTGWDETPSAPRIRSGGQLKFSSQEWIHKLATVELNEEDVARLVLDYLQVTERSESAEEFIKEAGIRDSKSNERESYTHTSSSPSSSPSMLQNGDSSNSPLSIPPGRRAAIRRSLMDDSDPFKTECMVNDVDPDILISNPSIHLQLRLAQLVKLVNVNEQTPAELLKFVQDKITPLTESNDTNNSTAILENAMMLITFGNKNNLYDDSFIHKLAEDVDGCILEHFDMSSTPLLTSIVKYMAMEQSKATSNDDAICIIPQLNDLQRCTFTIKRNTQTAAASNGDCVTRATERNGSGRLAAAAADTEGDPSSSEDDDMPPFTTLIRSQGSIDDSSDADGTN